MLCAAVSEHAVRNIKMAALHPAEFWGPGLSLREASVGEEALPMDKAGGVLRRSLLWKPVAKQAKRATTACRCVFGKMGMGYDHFIFVESLGHHACGEVGPAHPTGPSGFGADRVISRSRTTGRLYRGASCCARGGGWPPGSRLRQTMAPQKAMHSGHRTGAVVLWW